MNPIVLPDEPSAPLTRGQQLMWAAQNRRPGTPLYNMAFRFDVDGPLVRPCFEAAFEDLVQAHDALRTIFLERDGQPYQRVLKTVEYSVESLDFSDRRDPAAAWDDWTQVRCEANLPLDVRPFEVALAKLGSQRFAWFLNLHHLVTDAWSFSLLFDRLAEAYQRRRSAGLESVPEHASFASYRAFEEEARKRRGISEPESPKGRGSLTPPVLYGRPHSLDETRNYRVPCDLGVERSRRLRELAQSPEVGAFTVELGVFRLLTTVVFSLLQRASGLGKLSVGAPAHNRVRPEHREVVGLLTEVFPLAVEFEENETFRSLQEKVRDATDQFLRSAGPGASEASQNRRVRVVVNYLRAGFADFAGAPVRATWLHPGHVDPEHQWRLQIHEYAQSGSFTLLFDLSEDVFEAERRQEVIDHFLALLDAMLDNWDQDVSLVELPSVSERRRLDALLAGAEASPQASSFDVMASFDQQVASVPEAVAMVSGDRAWTYRDLDGEVSQIAARLNSGQLVGVLMSRSAEAIQVILGVLRAGSGYVPLDPSWPAPRIAEVIEDAGCELIISDRADRWPGGTSIGQLRKLAPVRRGEPEGVDGASLAYVLYTSGSTGRPKGVMVEHRALANYVHWAREKYDAGNARSFALFTPLTFDLTVTSIFVPLAAGGTIVVFPAAPGPPDLAIQRVFEDKRVDVVKLTPSHLSLLHDRDLSSTGVTQLIFGGEDLLVATALRLHRRLGGRAVIHNEYGPTEATVGCLAHVFDPLSDIRGSVPIGRPIAGMKARICDPGGRPVPFGVVGELWVGGPGLARGYLGLSTKTGEAFQETLDGRMYRTGDRARLRRDGLLEYCGRDDDQVKVRGVRVELGEVEAAVASHPGVVGCVAAVKDLCASGEAGDPDYCARCGLSSVFPATTFGPDGVCGSCRGFEAYEHMARAYFGEMSELQEKLLGAQEVRPNGYACLVLLSGGKDSTYMLGRLVDMGLRVLAFTLDNGFISEEAKANIGRVVDALDVDHVFGSTSAMNQIFVDSLNRHANVCHGCFKTIYTLSMQLAQEKSIPYIVTGLSRGQFFETRLTPDLFTDLAHGVDRIDEDVLLARKAYHRVDDAVSRLMDVTAFEDDEIFNDVQFLDFYRYCDVDLTALYGYLDERLPWVRPSDTGRSTNCLINDVGIYVHKQVRGFHNYALPYSWDVRLGHKTRAEALEELQDEIDLSRVQEILTEIGYPEDVEALGSHDRLVAYYVTENDVSPAELRRHTQGILPAAMVPSVYFRIPSIPLTRHGKTDRTSLPEPWESRAEAQGPVVPAKSERQLALVGVWEEVLGVSPVGIRDNFFALGGDSIMAIQVVARARRLGVVLTLETLFGSPTVEALAAAAEGEAPVVESVLGPVSLTPAQAWFFHHQSESVRFNNVVRLASQGKVDLDILTACLTALVDQHGSLRQHFEHVGGAWRGVIAPEVGAVQIQSVDASNNVEAARRELVERLQAPFDVSQSPLLRVVRVRSPTGSDQLVLIAHHLIVDAISWSVLIDDLSSLYSQIAAGRSGSLPPASLPVELWVRTQVAKLRDADPSERSSWEEIVREDRGGASGGGVTTKRFMAHVETLCVDFDTNTTANLTEAATRSEIGVDEVLLSSLAATLAEAQDEPAARFLIEGHGRRSGTASQDLSRTVGWLTSLYPVNLEVPVGRGSRELLRTVRSQLRSVPGRGDSYGFYRFPDPDAIARAGVGLQEEGRVLFNYLGREVAPKSADHKFEMSGKIRLDRAPEAAWPFLFEVNAVITEGQLQVTWAFHREVHQRAYVEALVRRFRVTLESVVDSCFEPDLGPSGPEDIPLAKLDEAEYDKLASLLAQPKRSEV